MAFDISRFVTPEQQFKGFEQLGETLAAQQAAKAKAAEADKARKAGLETQLGAFVKPEDFKTDTVNDPYFTKNVYDLLEKGQQLINTPGMDWSTVKNSLTPYVSQLAQSRDNVVQTRKQFEKAYDIIKDDKGIDKQKFADNFYRRAFYTKDENGNLVLKNTKDMSQIDPTHNYADDTLKEDDVYTSGGILEHLKDVGNVDYGHTQVSRDRRGKEVSTMYDVKSSPDFQPTVDEKTGRPTGTFEPRYQVFKDGDQVQMHTWLGDKGEETKAPIKLLDEAAYNRLLNTSRGSAIAFIRNKTKQITDQYGIDITSPQAEYLSRAIAYDYYKDNMPKDASIKLKEGEKFPVTKNYFNMPGSGEGAMTIKDVYKTIKDSYAQGQKAKNAGEFGEEKKGQPYMQPINELIPDAQNTLLDIVNKNIYDTDDKYSQADVYIVMNPQGTLEVRSAKEINKDALIMPLDYTSFNISAKQPGKKAQEEVIVRGKKEENAPKGYSKSKQQPKITSYSPVIQDGIKAYMKAKNLTEQQAIQKLITAGKIKG